MKKLLLPVALLALSSATFAQKWNVETSQAPYKKATFNIDEGTWMNLDVSPDGQRIVFDLLGDIYSMPVKGGKASLLAGGRAWEVQPRYSPDGKHISFTSDREGGDNIWIMNYDGTGKRAITKESFRLLNNASWSADAQYLVARKHFTAGRSLGAGEMWLYNKNGGDGIQLTKRKNDQQDAGEPILSPDNKYLYWSEDMTPGPSFQYNKDPNEGIYEIRRLNRQTGATETVTGGTGGACRPQISPDGKLMAFVRRVRLKSVLFLHNLQTGEEWPVYDDLSHDQQETWAIFGVYPNFAWTPDGKNIIFYAKGKIRNLDVASLNVTQIPFEVTSTQSYAEALHFPQRVFSEDFAVKMVRQATTSPDGKTIAFNAAGYIYVKQLPSGKPERITNTNELEYAPEFSPDGKSLVYTSWSDELKGSINIIDLNTKAITRLVSDKGFYYTPKFSNKGDKIVYRKGEGNESLGFAFGKNPGIYTVSVTGDATPQLIINNGINPQFSTDDSKIYYQSWENGQKAFRVMDASGANARTLYTSQYATQFAPSPDGKWMAFTELFNCYVTPMVNSGNPQNLSASNKALPLNKLTRDAGTNLHWSRDSKKLMWVLGPRYFARDIKSAFPFIEGDDKTPPVDTVGTDIGLRLPSDLPDGKIAFTNARIITMKGDEVIEKGTIVIERNKIIAVGKDVQAPADAKVYDIAGKTIMPGIIDVHAHLRPSPDGVTPQQDWSYYANLAYGVTTAHDPSSNTEMVFSQNEMLRSGRMVGPRVYSTGSILYGADGDFKVVINSLEDARSHLRRLKAVGASSVKSYNQPRREQRQQVIEAARDLQMEVVPEGGSTFFNNMNQILDGHTGIEHNIPVYPVYKDVREFWNASKTAYTPTLIVSYGTQFGETYWYARNDVWKNDHLLSYTPMSIIDARSRRRIISEYGDYGHIDVSRAVKQIASGGTKINLGAHGQIQGIGAHWELWMLAQGGMTPLQSIRCATINGAAYLGMDKEIGSLEPGKLADLVVINENPLDDIRNSEKIKYTMINGRLYDVDSMNEIGNREKPRLQFWWQMNRGEMSALPVGNTETYQYMSEIDDN